MTTLPLSLNIFKQLEIYQSIKRLDEQFNQMLVEWKRGAYKKIGLSKKVNINYPTWEIERKILLWTAQHHKHLGSPITTGHLHEKNIEFLKDIYVSQTELVFAGSENILKNLVARGLATWDNGALISQQGLGYGLIIGDLYELKNDDSIKTGEVKYRDKRLIKKRLSTVGYELVYWAGLLIIFLSLLFLGFSIYKNLNLSIRLPSWVSYIKYFLAVISFLPAFIFMMGIFLIKLKK